MTPNVAAATAFLKAMKDKDLSQAPLADNVSYEGPLSGEPIRGRDHVSRFLTRLSAGDRGRPPGAPNRRRRLRGYGVAG
jgi:hypothetical protein